MARNTIKTRISLEGGKQIEADLKALGVTGEKAFDQIRKAALKADLAKFGDSVGTLGRDLATVGRRLALAFTGIATAAAAAGIGLVELAKGGAEAADAAGKAAEKTGLQIDAYGRLAFAAQQADVDQEAFIAGMSKLNKAIAGAAKESTKAGDTFNQTGVKVTRFGEKAKKAEKPVGSIFSKLGVSLKDANGKLRDTESILGDVAEAFARMPEGPQKAALAIELFGKSGANLLPFLNQGKKGLRDLGKEAQRLGLIFTPEQFQLGDALGDALDELSAAVKATKNQLGLLFAPIVLAGAETFRDAIVQNKDALLAFGRIAASETAGILSDLIRAFSGRSDLRHPWILVWRDAILNFAVNLKAVVNGVIVPLFKAVQKVAQSVATAINAVFGTDITAGQVLLAASILKLLGVFRALASLVPVIVNGGRLIASAFAFLAGRGALGAAALFFRAIIAGALTFIGLIASLVGWPALIVAGLVAAAAAIVVFWDDIKAGALAAYQLILSLFSASGFANLITSAREIGTQFVAALFGGIRDGLTILADLLAPENLQPLFNSIILAGEQAGKLFVEALKLELVGAFTSIGTTSGLELAAGFIIGVRNILLGIPQLVAQAIVSFGPAIAGVLLNALKVEFLAVQAFFQGVADFIIAFIAGIGEQIVTELGSFTNRFAGAALDVWNQAAATITETVFKIADVVRTGFTSAIDAVRSAFDGLVSFAGSVVDRIGGFLSNLVSRISSAFRALKQLVGLQGSDSGSSGGSNTTNFASGGSVRGPGSSTSDSIFARLSNGEFVIKARAVAHYGPNIMAALNAMRLPKNIFRGFNVGGMVESVRASFGPGFSVGGMVDGFSRSMALPRFAGGGAVTASLAPIRSGGTPVTLQLPGGDTFFVGEVINDDDVAGRLGRFVSKKSVNSTGRGPGWRR